MSFLKELRDISGCSVKECAEVAQMDIEQYQKYEDGLIDPRNMTVLEFAKLFRLMPITIDPIYVLEKMKEEYKGTHSNEYAVGN